MKRFRTAILVGSAVLAIAAVAGASGSGNHQGLGSGTNGTDTVTVLLPIDEASQSGTVLVNNAVVQISCVSVQPSGGPPGFHKLYAAGQGGGALWNFEIGDSPSGDALGVANAPGFGPCNTSAVATTVTTGNFVIIP